LIRFGYVVINLSCMMMNEFVHDFYYF
jgi:hypothetical protein